MIPGMRCRKNSWSLDDETTLRRLLLAGHTAQDVSAVLKRSVDAIGNKARALGLSQHTLPDGSRQWYEPQSPPENVAARNKPKPASAVAWSDPDRPAPRYSAEDLWRVWSEALQRVEVRNGR